jgi:GNAT superfamily N-acetyltransferase
LKEFREPGVRLVLITEKYEEVALKFAREHYIAQEPMNKGFGVKWTDDVEAFFRSAFKLRLSLMFLNERDDDPIAFRVTRKARYDDKSDIDEIKDQPLKELFRCMDYCEQKTEFFGHYQTKEAFHFIALAVAPKYKQLGYGTKIVNVAIDMIRHFGFDPVYLKVEGSSNFSQKIFKKTGMEMLFELFFDDWEVEGRKIIQNMGIHKSVRMYGMKLSTA